MCRITIGRQGRVTREKTMGRNQKTLAITDSYGDSLRISRSGETDGAPVNIAVSDQKNGDERQSSLINTDDIRNISKFFSLAADRIDKANGKTRPKKRKRKDMAKEIGRLKSSRADADERVLKARQDIAWMVRCLDGLENTWHASMTFGVHLMKENERMKNDLKKQAATIEEQDKQLRDVNESKYRLAVDKEEAYAACSEHRKGRAEANTMANAAEVERDEMLGLIRERYGFQDTEPVTIKLDGRSGVSDDWYSRMAAILKRHESKQPTATDEPTEEMVIEPCETCTSADACYEIPPTRGRCGDYMPRGGVDAKPDGDTNIPEIPWNSIIEFNWENQIVIYSTAQAHEGRGRIVQSVPIDSPQFHGMVAYLPDDARFPSPIPVGDIIGLLSYNTVTHQLIRLDINSETGKARTTGDGELVVVVQFPVDLIFRPAPEAAEGVREFDLNEAETDADAIVVPPASKPSPSHEEPTL